MKRILSAILAVFMLVPLFVFGVSAEGEGETASCTIGSKNIANEASVGYVGSAFWAIDEGKLVDGDATAMAHSPKMDFNWSLKFGSLKTINKVVLQVNGTGSCTKCGGEHTANAYDCARSVSIKLYDDTGKAIYESEWINLVDETDPENPVIATEAKFEFEEYAVSTVDIFVKTSSYGSAYFREIEIYQVIGEHAWVLDEENTIPSSCEDSGTNIYNCACGATKEEETNQHTVEEWRTINAPTTSASGNAIGDCVVPGCGGQAGKILPRLSLTDNEKKLNLDNITIIEDIKNIQDYVDEGHADYNNDVYMRNPDMNAEALFDNVIDTDTFSPTNFWCGTAFGVKRVLVPDDPATPDVDETQYEIETPDDPETLDKDETKYAYDYYYSTLTIEFDQVYSLTQVELYLYSNWNNFTIEFKDAEGETIKQIVKNNFQNYSFGRMIFTGDIYGENIKSIVLTVTEASWAGGKGLAFTELKLSAHECQFTDAEIASGKTENCVTTFSGTCSVCQAERTDAKLVSHTWEKDETNTTEDKILEVITEVSCFKNGKVKKHCTACDQDIAVVLNATEEHQFGETLFDKEGVTLKPTCGDNGLGYEKCTVEGCVAESDLHSVAPQGEHTFKWLEKSGQEADYTHDGVKAYMCSVCSTIDESKGTQVSEKISAAKFVSAKDWSVRYTDFVSPKATFKIATTAVNQIEQNGFSVKIYGVVKKGEEIREVQIYGDGATGNMRKDGTFSLVVKDSSYTDNYNFSVRIVVTCDADQTTAETIVFSKNLSTAGDGQVSASDVAKYYLLPNKVNSVDPALKTFYEKISAE